LQGESIDSWLEAISRASVQTLALRSFYDSGYRQPHLGLPADLNRCVLPVTVEPGGLGLFLLGAQDSELTAEPASQRFVDMMLMRTDPFRDLDRWTQQVLGTASRPAVMPMDAWRDVISLSSSSTYPA
jgi:hypothetical protein